VSSSFADDKYLKLVSHIERINRYYCNNAIENSADPGKRYTLFAEGLFISNELKRLKLVPHVNVINTSPTEECIQTDMYNLTNLNHCPFLYMQAFKHLCN